MAHPFTTISPRGGDGAENGDGENSVPDDDIGSGGEREGKNDINPIYVIVDGWK